MIKELSMGQRRSKRILKRLAYKQMGCILKRIKNCSNPLIRIRMFGQLCAVQSMHVIKMRGLYYNVR